MNLGHDRVEGLSGCRSLRTISGVPSGLAGGAFCRARRGTSSGFSSGPPLPDAPPPPPWADGAMV
jgi:hypothetical protein